MWIPTKIYEALPALYLTIGVLTVLCAIYIGASHGLMPGYIFFGVSCMIAGLFVWMMRKKARSQSGKGNISSQTENTAENQPSPQGQ